MHRRRCLLALASASALGALAALGATGCGGGDDGAPDASPRSFPVSNSDDSGHLHAFEIRCADLDGLEARSYETDGETHQHTVLLGADQLTALAAGETVTISFTDGHAHIFVIEPPGDLC